MAKEIENININGEAYEVGKIYSKMGLSFERFVELLGRDFYCPVLASDPTTTTTTYTDTDGSENEFQRGQFALVADAAAEGGYKVWQCLSNNGTAAVWKLWDSASGDFLTKETADTLYGTYSKPSGGIPKTDLASAVQTSLGKADTALQSYTEQYKGTVTGVKINGTTKNPSSGVVDLGTVITEHQDISGKQDTLVSGSNIKTINGTSILGSGNIVISGGSGDSSGGSGAYAEVSHGTSDTTFTLTPNTFHVWDEVTALDLSFGDETAGVANEYLFQFTSGATATTLTLPDDIKWANDTAPTIAENMIYQISVLKGLASVLEFSNAALLIENYGTYNAGTMMSGATLTFEYPVASDLTINLQYAASETVILPKGQSSITIDWAEPAAPRITSIIPLQDDTYIYII